MHFLTTFCSILKDINNQELGHSDPKNFLKTFFDSKSNQELFQDIEIILQTITVAYIKYSNESVLESITSVYANDFNSSRNKGL